MDTTKLTHAERLILLEALERYISSLNHQIDTAESDKLLSIKTQKKIKATF